MTQVSMIEKIVLGRYRIVRKLASGGMGVIYLARSEGAAGFVKPVVIKRIHSDMDQGTDRSTGLFIREAQILAAMRHPDVLSVLDFGSEDGAYVMVLEYIHGFHLGQWARYLRRTKRSMPSDIAIHVTIRVLDALEYAHNLTMDGGERGSVIHRDVTPSNVLLDVNGSLKLADFGIASARSGNSQAMTVSTGQVRGKLSYIAPELFNSSQPSPASDIYSCGVMLHELLLGRNEFAQKEDAATINRVLNHRATPVTSLRHDVPNAIDDVMARALAKDPRQRYASAAEFARDLRKCLSVSEADARANLTRRVSEDFCGDIAEVLETSPLSELESAWRSGLTPGGNASSSRTGRTVEEVTKVADYSSLQPTGDGPGAVPQDAPPVASGDSDSRPDPRRWLVPIVVFAGLLAALGAVVSTKLASAPPPVRSPNRYIVVEGTRSPASVVAAEGAETTAEAPQANDPSAAPSAEVGRTGVAAVSPRRAPPRRAPVAVEDPAAARARALTQAFGQKRARVQACFDQHAGAITGHPRVQVRFSIDAAGEVQTVGLDPASLQQTDLGHCLVQVAQTTHFGPQPARASFAIPVTATYR